MRADIHWYLSARPQDQKQKIKQEKSSILYGPLVPGYHILKLDLLFINKVPIRSQL